MQVKELGHLVLYVRNLDRSRRFYRDVLELQHRDLQSSLNLHATVPQPESHVQLIDSGVEITITYPVQIRRVNEIDNRVTREVMRQFESDPNLTIAKNSGSKGEVAVG